MNPEKERSERQYFWVGVVIAAILILVLIFALTRPAGAAPAEAAPAEAVAAPAGQVISTTQVGQVTLEQVAEAAKFGLVLAQDGKTFVQLNAEPQAMVATNIVASNPITRYVSVTGTMTLGCDDPANPCSLLRYAVQSANPGDSILVGAGTYNGTWSCPYFFNCFSHAVITKTVSIVGSPEGDTFFDAQNTGLVLYSNQPFTMSQFTLQHGNDMYGGCLYNTSVAKLNEITLTHCSGAIAGAASFAGTGASGSTLNRVRILSNTTTYDGWGSALTINGASNIEIRSSAVISNVGAKGGMSINGPANGISFLNTTLNGNGPLNGFFQNPSGYPVSVHLTNTLVSKNTLGVFGGNSIFMVNSFWDSPLTPPTDPAFIMVNNSVGGNALLLPDGFHISSNSDAKGLGSNCAAEDIDGQQFALPCSLGADEPWPQPQASFSCWPEEGMVPLETFCENLSTNFVDSLWSFGDGFTSTERAGAVHTYTVPSVYTVTLTVTGPGGSDTLTRANYINVRPPVRAGFYAEPLSGAIPLTVTFVNTSTGHFLVDRFDFGDGSMASSLPNRSVQHVFQVPGVYTVSLWVGMGMDGEDWLTRTNYISVLKKNEIVPYISSIVPTSTLPGGQVRIIGGDFLPQNVPLDQMSVWFQSDSSLGASIVAHPGQTGVIWGQYSIILDLPKNLQPGPGKVWVVIAGHQSNRVLITVEPWRLFLPVVYTAPPPHIW